MSRAAVKPGKHDDIKAKIDALRKETHDLPGVKFWMSLLSSDGVLTVIGGYPDKATCEGTSHVNKARWESAQDLLQESPTIIEGEIIAFMAPRE